jgi:hypothetical protein
LKLYSAYGLTIESALPLPDLTSGKGRVDVRISLAPPAPTATEEIVGIQCLSATPASVHLSWRGVGELVVEDGNRILVTPAPNSVEEALRLFVVGAAFGVLLHQRGLLVLHGSAVVIGGRVVGFLGSKGWGKSTTAMALTRRGHRIVADELLVIRLDGVQAWVMSGSYPVKLRSDALTTMGGDPATSVPVRPGHQKYFVSGSTITDGEFPLQSLVLLDAGATLALAPVPTAEAFFGVVPHVYVSRFGTGFLNATGADRTFKQLGLLLKRTSVMRLYRQRDLSQLQEIAELVESHSQQ